MNTSPSIKIEIDHRVEEHIKADRLSYLNSSRLANVDRFLAVFFALLGIFLVVAVGPRWWTLIWFLLAPLEYFNLLSIRPWVIRCRFKKTPKFHEKNELIFSENGVYFRTPSIDSNLKWDLYIDSIDSEEFNSSPFSRGPFGDS